MRSRMMQKFACVECNRFLKKGRSAAADEKVCRHCGDVGVVAVPAHITEELRPPVYLFRVTYKGRYGGAFKTLDRAESALAELRKRVDIFD